jgi:hypothetical protein
MSHLQDLTYMDIKFIRAQIIIIYLNLTLLI